MFGRDLPCSDPSATKVDSFDRRFAVSVVGLAVLWLVKLYFQLDRRFNGGGSRQRRAVPQLPHAGCSRLVAAILKVLPAPIAL
jgi:hypothetical protein